MYLSLNWINDYVDTSKIETEVLIKRLGLATCEIEGVERKGEDISGIITAKLIEVKDVQGSSKLHKVKLDIGNGKQAECLCGAPNARAGIITAFAQLGANVKGLEIKEVKMAGDISRGMCCALDELGGCEEKCAGIIELPENIPLGIDIKKVLPLADTIIEVDNKSLTNRPDLWCHEGFAREIAAIFNLPMKQAKLKDIKNAEGNKEIDISIKQKYLCRRYSAVLFSNITKKEAPLDMQIRLYYAGMRAINILTDLSNFVMLDIGQPTHAFDGDKVKKITVDKAADGEKIVTLDGKERTLSSNMLTIRSGGKAEAIAGVMGGETTKITETTTSVCLESANFTPETIRLTARGLGLTSEASQRYEKTLDPELTIKAIKRFWQLLSEIDKSAIVASNLSDSFPNPYKEVVITLTKKFVDDRCGFVTKKGEIEKVLKALTFNVKTEGDNIIVKVPSYRATKDITIKEDLVEEFARVYGYDNIVPVAPVMEVKTNNIKRDLEYKFKHYLASEGLNEVHTYIWNDVKFNNEINIKTNSYLKTVNSINPEDSEIRSEIVPSLLKVAYQNRVGIDNVRIFEIGRGIFGLKDGIANEKKHLGIVIASKNNEEAEFYKLQTIVYNALKAMFNVEPKFTKQWHEAAIAGNYHPENAFDVYTGDIKIAEFGVVHPRISRHFSKETVLACEIYFTRLEEMQAKLIKPREVSKQQSTKLDFTFKTEKGEPFGKLKEIAERFESKLEKELKLVEIFDKGEFNATTINFKVVSLDHTLTSDEINSFVKGFIDYMANNGYKLSV